MKKTNLKQSALFISLCLLLSMLSCTDSKPKESGETLGKDTTIRKGIVALKDSTKTLWKVKQSSFTNVEISSLVDSISIKPFLCKGCSLAGVIFSIDSLSDTTQYLEAYSAILTDKKSSGNAGDVDIIFERINSRSEKGLPSSTPIQKLRTRGKNRKTISVLPSDYQSTKEFEIVFFSASNLNKLANYKFADGKHKSNGILLERVLEEVNNVKFQSLKAYTDLPLFDPIIDSIASNIDRHEAVQFGTPCPPTWKDEPSTPSTSGVQYSNIIKLSNGRQINLNNLYELFKKKKQTGSIGEPHIPPFVKPKPKPKLN